MNAEQNSQLQTKILEWGASLVGFADLEGLVPERWQSLHTGISIAVRLSHGIMDEIQSKPNHLYAHHYDVLNNFLDTIALKTTNLLQSWSYNAIPIPASTKTPAAVAEMSLSHKMVATCAGLGWIGKNILLITPEYGPRVRLASVLTDAPLNAASPNWESNCGKCKSCVVACPGKALRGINWATDKRREDLFIIDHCRKEVHQNKEIFGSTVCGVCISACPIGKSR